MSPDVRRHDGFFLRGGFGLTWLRSRGHYDQSGDNYFGPSSGPPPQSPGVESLGGAGVAVELAVGGTIPGGVVIAGQLMSHMVTGVQANQDAPSAHHSDFSIKYTTVGLLVMYYPNDRGGFSSGLAGGSMTGYRGESDEGASGWFLAPQLGYEWWVSEQTSLGLLLRAAFARLTGSSDYYHYYGSSSGDYTNNVALPALSVTLTLH